MYCVVWPSSGLHGNKPAAGQWITMYFNLFSTRAVGQGEEISSRTEIAERARTSLALRIIPWTHALDQVSNTPR